MNAGNSADVLCPFYRKDKGLSIGCEGMAEGINISLIFTSGGNKDEYVECYCCTYEFINCEIYKIVIKKYEEEDE